MERVGGNLRRFRLLKNLSLREAGELLNMSAPAVAKYEKGEIIPNSQKLIEFARAYGVKVLDLLKVSNKVEMNFISFRKKKRLTGEKLELLKDIIQNKVSDYLEVIEMSEINSDGKEIKKYVCENILDAEEAADTFRIDKQLSLNQPIYNLINVLENIGIVIVLIDDKDDMFKDFDGLSEIVNNVPVIVLKNDTDGARQRFTVAHELGHLVLDIKDESIDKEKLCNRFASSLLMPKTAINNEFGVERKRVSIYELKAFKREYKVSIAAILYRLKDLKVISEWEYKKINIIMSNMGINKKEPIEINPEKSWQFEKIVRRLEIDGIISLSRACELLEVSVDKYEEDDNN